MLTGNAGATISGGPVILNNNSNFPVNIGTGNSTGAITIGNSSNTITLPAFNQAGVVHNNATGLLSTGLIVNDDITNGTINLTTKVTGILPISNGGTNSGTALQNHRVMVSRNGQIVEAGHLANGMIIVGKDDDEPQLVTMNGDITINNTGITAIGSGRVLTNMLSDEAVTSVKIVDGGVTTIDLADNSVTSAKIVDGGVATVDLADNSVTSVKIVDGGVVTADLADNSVTSAKIVDGGVLTADLADNAVTTVKITDANVTPAKIAPGANNQVLVTDGTGAVAWIDRAAFGAIADQVTIEGDGTTTNPFKVKDLGITTAKLADGAVTTVKLSDGTVTTVKLADGSVTTPKLAADAVLTGNILNETILSEDIKDGEIAMADLANNAVTYNKIQNLSTTGRLLGSSSDTNPVQEITLGSGLSLTGTTLSASGLGGTVTSVGLSLPSFITVTNSPVTGSGVLTGTLTSQLQNTVFAAPDGASGAPTFRSLLSNDIPNLDWAKITTGKPTTLAGYGITDAALSTHNHTVDGLSNVNISGKANNDILQWDGTSWVNKSLSGAGLITTETDPVVKAINGIIKSNGTTISAAVAGTDYVTPNASITAGTNTKISYDSKGLVTGGTSAILASADYVNQGTVSSVLHGNASGNPSWGQIVNSDVDASAGIDATKLVTGVVDNSEFNALDGVTTGIQTQINSKANISGQVFTGAISATNLSGTNTGDVSLGTGGENYLSLTGQVLTASAVNLSGTNVTGILAAGRFPALTGDVTTSAGSLGTTISANAVTYSKIQNLSTTGRLLGSSSDTNPVQEITLGSGLSLTGTTLSASGLGVTVTSVGLSLPSFITVTNSPVTGSGVLTGTLTSQLQNTVFAAPDGASGAPTFRSLLSNDIPNLDWAKITTGKPTTLAGYGITDAALSTHNHTVDGLSNVNISGKANNDILQWDGTSWVNKSLSGAGLITTETDPVVKAINGIIKSNGTTISAAVAGTDYVTPNASITAGTNTKISYDSKGLVTGGTSAILASADYVNQGTVSSVLHGNASGNPSWGQIVNSDVDASAGIDATKLVTGVVDNSEFNALDGVTTGIQTQINSKANISGQVFTGAISATNLSGTNTGDVSLGTGGENYLSLTGQVLTASAVNLSGTNVTGILAAGRFPALTGDVTTSAGSLGTTISANAVTYSKIQNLSTTGRLLGSSSDTNPVQEITLGSGLSLTGTTLSASGLGGTVTSVGLSLPSFITVTNSPVTGSGVLTGTLTSQLQNTVFAAPDGASGAPTFRSLLSNDIPNLDWAKITTGKPTTLAGYGITDAALSTHNHTVDGLSNVNISGKANNDILQWDGTSWVNKSLSGAGLITTETDPVVKAINGIIKSNGTTISAAVAGTDYVTPNASITAGTNTKISYDSKGLVTGGTSAILASADYVNQGTVSSVLHGNASGNPSWGQIVNSDVDASAGIDATKLVTGVVDNSEFNALDGVTTGIQTQINSKANISGQVFTGAISATNLSGTNTGDVSLGTGGENYLSLTGQVLTASAVNLSGTNVTGILAAGRFPALTGDVTTSAGSLGTTISANAVTYSKIQNLSTTGRLLGSSSDTNPVQEITLGSGLSLTGTTLSASGLGGTVTSVGLSLPSFITVTNSPVTGSGVLTGTLTSQLQNTVFAAPDGASGAPTFRSLLSNDIPNLDWAKITTGKPTTLAGYGIIDGMSTSHAANGITSTNITNWTSAYGWGNHAVAGYLTGTVSVTNGGTGITSLTDHGILLGSGTDPVSVTGTGSAGQVLQSGGSGADPGYSNSAYPSDAGQAGNILRSDGTNFISTPINFRQQTPADPTGTNNTTGLMMGLGHYFTPARSGSVMIIISGTIRNSSGTTGNGAKVQIRYGTDSAPVNGTAITGTAAGSLIEASNISNGSNRRYPFTVNSIITSLPVGTQHWFDLSLGAISGGTAYLYDLSVSIIEL